MLILIIFTILDWLPSGLPIKSSRLCFVEFVEEGVNYYDSKSLLRNAFYLMSVLVGNDCILFKRYEEIRSVRILKHKRYMKPYGYPTYPPPVEVASMDFIFSFVNGEELFIYAPMILNHDGEELVQILKSKVSTIDDPHKCLDKLMNKEC